MILYKVIFLCEVTTKDVYKCTVDLYLQQNVCAFASVGEMELVSNLPDSFLLSPENFLLGPYR